ncbi:MAG: hypothetical protein MHMPM18_004249 [Marteilia pararefringens]
MESCGDNRTESIQKKLKNAMRNKFLDNKINEINTLYENLNIIDVLLDAYFLDAFDKVLKMCNSLLNLTKSSNSLEDWHNLSIILKSENFAFCIERVLNKLSETPHLPNYEEFNRCSDIILILIDIKEFSDHLSKVLDEKDKIFVNKKSSTYLKDNRDHVVDDDCSNTYI